ncbi:MAG TPA: cytochrome c biogenesis protein ResB, partial [Candidatus Synoicihabitans sp.]|nr:cytochrome c biogenesis protein ResB [Candidatus Synoicihabitans sp.]
MSPWKPFVTFFTSLRLTVVLLVLSMVLVFWATLAQVQLGVWGVQEKFFRTFFVLGYVPNTRIPVPLYPGGYFLGGLLLINLIVSHVYRFRFTWAKAGIQLTHAGLILLLVGELLTGLMQEEFQLRLGQGETRNYSESFRLNEVAIIETTDPHYDDVVAIPEEIIAKGAPVQHPKLPFRVVPRFYLPNANLTMQSQLPAGTPTVPNTTTQGIGPRLAVIGLPITYRDNERNLPVAYLELIGNDGSLGTWLVSPMLVQAQTFDFAGRNWRIEFRFAREYKPFSLTLLELRHDIYPGSDIPKNFSSRVRITDAAGGNEREALIYMNNPLRYEG